ncbi:MAG: phage holin family protein [Candidatus Accumulibacter sp.]|jgi:uncharacterized membrane protein YqjE|uniref:Phage holin family protein n=1 Tax=Candidatus Accumulibacter affinis TaxID=2954384 RepID=A0A935T5V3_9PROT|nr:phage holin family protein [Candidatus Accumulibacter affinis]MBP9804474.1 phage holin family protein [Accumulibacter sp.]
MSETPVSGGLLAATRNSAATLLATGRTRLELLGNEIKEEKLRAVRVVLLSQVAAFCLMIGTILAVGLLIVVFWDNRLLVLGGFIAFFWAAGGFAYVALRRSLSSTRKPFASSIAELGEDLRQLRGAARNESGTD